MSAITNQAAGYNPPALDMTHTAYNRVSSITQQGSVTKKLNLYYGPDNQRRKTQYYENGVLKKTKYFVGDYEKEGLKEFDYIYTPEGMAAVAVKEQNNTRVIYYTHTDHLGSVRVYTQSGSSSPSAMYDYDAWGKRTFRGGSVDQFSRGYLGQEHLPEFGLINLNARMYDPVLGRFLGVDPYVQAPDFTQSHNRYVYGLNNPMRYVDPDGEFIWTIINGVKDLFVNTFVRPWTEGFNAWSNKENWHSTTMAWKVDIGLYRGDFKQVLSRFTWELPQTMLGYMTNGILVTSNSVRSVTHWGGATAVETYSSDWGGFTLGSYITGSRGLQADPNNTLFQHEYGHYLQSQSWGLAYLSRGAIPSLFDTFGHGGDHQFHPIEQDANMRAYKYFNENVAGFYESTEGGVYSGTGWNFTSNPLDIQGNGSRNYIDYHNAEQMALVNALKVNPSVFDYMTGGSFFSTLIYGFRNHVHYNKHKYRKH